MDRYVGIIVKSKDIYCLLCELKELGWESLRETSINRLIYLSSVLYSFINNEIENIFAKSYQFTITLSGPEDAEIEKALIHLESNGLVKHTDKGYAVIEGTNPLIIDEEYEEKKAWFKDIAYIISIYGEDKIYDFIFRDPEYRESLLGNSVYNLNIDKNNATVKFLNKFKFEFEKVLNDKSVALDNRKYMELYFEYVFGMILRGEV